MEYSEIFSAECVSGPERCWIVSRRLSGEVRATRDPVDDPRLNRPLNRPLDRVWIATGSATLTPTIPSWEEHDAVIRPRPQQPTTTTFCTSFIQHLCTVEIYRERSCCDGEHWVSHQRENGSQLRARNQGGWVILDGFGVLKECHLYVYHNIYEIMTVQACFLVFTSPSCTHFPVARFDLQKSSSYYCRRDNCDESIPRTYT